MFDQMIFDHIAILINYEYHPLILLGFYLLFFISMPTFICLEALRECCHFLLFILSMDIL